MSRGLIPKHRDGRLTIPEDPMSLRNVTKHRVYFLP